MDTNVILEVRILFINVMYFRLTLDKVIATSFGAL